MDNFSSSLLINLFKNPLQMTILLLIWALVLAVIVLRDLKRLYSTFSKDGIKHFKPVPLLGNMSSVIFRRNHYADNILKFYKSFPDEKFVGRFEFVNQSIVILDLELVKKIAIKDFEHFLDHRNFGAESFFSRTLFLLAGQEWKDMRSTLTPAFTSSKIRLMVPFMVEVGDQMILSLKKKLEESKDDYIEVDCKDLTTRYANDVIASCAFGLKVDSHMDRDNRFYAMGRSLFEFGFRTMIMFFVLLNAPKVAKFFKWDIVPASVRKFFTNLVLDTMKDREMRHIIRPDMIHLLMEANKGKLTHEDIMPNDNAVGFATVEESAIGLNSSKRVWTDEDIVAQAFVFFAAGFETVSATMAFLLYELAVHPEVQERLAQEIREYNDKNGGKFDFNSIQDMKYMDMVVSEVLRKWPAPLVLDRICTKDYNLGKPNNAAEKDYIIRKGSGVQIPVYAFHNDPRYFPNPEKFDPERFSPDNKHKFNANAYMPFGVGPRNCIGSRFALCEVKVITYQILRHMEVSPCKSTCIPAKLATNNLNLRLKGGHSLRFKLRK